MTDLPTIWFVLGAFAVVAYVVLDGYDLGAAIVSPFVARDAQQRDVIARSIGPVWDGNEVWLLATGGTIVLAYPRLYAAAFSGFYLPLTLVLWLLIGRALAIELRHHVHHPIWVLFWDRLFVVSSVAVVVCFGAALGNVVRGVPIEDDGHFFLPLWADGDRPGVLDGFTLSVAAAALVALAMQGAAWIAWKSEGVLQSRARRAARTAAGIAFGTTAIVTALAWHAQPHIAQRLAEQPWIYGFAALAALGLLAVVYFGRRGQDAKALGASSAHLAGMLGAAVFGLYPYVLPSTSDPARSLTVSNAAAADSSLSLALWWWLPGVAIAIGWQAWAHRVFAGKVEPTAH